MAELYTLPDGWEWKTFDDELILIQNGLSDTQNDDKIGYPISRIETIQNETLDSNRIKYIDVDNYSIIEKYKYDYGDLLFSHINSFEKVGKTCLYTNQIDNLLHGVNLLRMKFTRNVISKFVFYYLISNVSRRFYEPHIKKAINQASINQKNIKSIPFPLPPLEEQKRIVAKLDILFAKIDKAIALHQKNIDEANVFMASVLNDVFVELEEKYGLIKINDVVVKTKNKNPLNEKDTPFTYIDISSIDNKSFKIVEPKQLIGSEAPSRAKKEVFQGDIVYSTTRPNLKNIAIVSENYNNPIASTGFCVLRTNEKTINSYLFYFLITEKLFEQIEPNIRGAQYPATSDNDLKNCNIPNTPYETQQKVVSYLDEISQKIEKIKQIQKEKMQSLKALKASILEQAFKGEL